MLPQLEKINFANGMDAKIYYGKKIKEYISTNKDTKEDLSKYNVEAVRQINGVLYDSINPTLVKFGTYCGIAQHMHNYNTFRAYITIIQSLQKQKKLIRSLRNTLKRARIDKIWYNIIEKYVVNAIADRCERLNKNIIPELIENSELYVYLKYLERNGVDFKDDIQPISECDFNSPEFIEYCDNVVKLGNEYFETLSENEKSEILNIRKRHEDAISRRREIMNKEEERNKKQQMESSSEEIKDMLSIHCHNLFDNCFKKDASFCESTRNLYNNIDKKVKESGLEQALANDIVVIALHLRQNNGFEKTKVRFVTSKGNSSTKTYSASSLFLSPLEDDKIKEIEKKYANYVTCVINLNDAKHYIENNQSFNSAKNSKTLNNNYLDAELLEKCIERRAEILSIICNTYNMMSLIQRFNKFYGDGFIKDNESLARFTGLKQTLSHDLNFFKVNVREFDRKRMLVYLEDCNKFEKHYDFEFIAFEDLIKINDILYLFYTKILHESTEEFFEFLNEGLENIAYLSSSEVTKKVRAIYGRCKELL